MRTLFRIKYYNTMVFTGSIKTCVFISVPVGHLPDGVIRVIRWVTKDTSSSVHIPRRIKAVVALCVSLTLLQHAGLLLRRTGVSRRRA